MYTLTEKKLLVQIKLLHKKLGSHGKHFLTPILVAGYPKVEHCFICILCKNTNLQRDQKAYHQGPRGEIIILYVQEFFTHSIK